jgi:hypothetical protein
VLQQVAAALDVMAAQQQYGSRHAHLLYHSRAWVRQWVAAGCSVAQLIAAAPLLCPAADALASDAALIINCSPEVPAAAAAPAPGAGGAPQQQQQQQQQQQPAARALLRCHGPALVFWAIFYDAQGVLDDLAAAAGLTEPALVHLYTHVTCSCVYPLLKAPEFKQQAGQFRRKLNASSPVCVLWRL